MALDSSSDAYGVLVVTKDTMQVWDVGVSFQRTLRIPEGSNTYPLTTDLGSFPIRRVSDYWGKVPASWQEHGGVFVPLRQSEAVWLKFTGREWKPSAIKVAAGELELCAVTGKPWSEKLPQDSQDYLVVPSCQPWLDGINSGNDTIVSQFIAPPLLERPGNENYKSLLQLFVCDPKPSVFSPRPPLDAISSFGRVAGGYASISSSCRSAGACYYGGAPDGGCKPPAAPPRASRGVEWWDQSHYVSVFVHLCNSRVWKEITGQDMPLSPVSNTMYSDHGLPWLQQYEEVLPPDWSHSRLTENYLMHLYSSRQ